MDRYNVLCRFRNYIRIMKYHSEYHSDRFILVDCELALQLFLSDAEKIQLYFVGKTNYQSEILQSKPTWIIWKLETRNRDRKKCLKKGLLSLNE